MSFFKGLENLGEVLTHGMDALVPPAPDGGGGDSGRRRSTGGVGGGGASPASRRASMPPFSSSSVAAGGGGGPGGEVAVSIVSEDSKETREAKGEIIEERSSSSIRNSGSPPASSLTAQVSAKMEQQQAQHLELLKAKENECLQLREKFAKLMESTKKLRKILLERDEQIKTLQPSAGRASQLEETLKERDASHLEEVTSLKSRLEEALTEASIRNEQQQNAAEDLQSNQLREALRHSTEHVAKLEETLKERDASHLEEVTSLKSRLEEALTEVRARNEQHQSAEDSLRAQIHEISSQCGILEEQLSLSRRELKVLKGNCDACDASKKAREKAQEEIERLRKELQSRAKELDAAAIAQQKSATEKEKLHTELQLQSARRKEAFERIRAMDSQATDAEKKLANKDDQLKEAQARINSLQSLQSQAEKENKLALELKSEVERMKQELRDAQKEASEFKSKHDASKDEIQDLKRKVKDAGSKVDDQVEALTMERDFLLKQTQVWEGRAKGAELKLEAAEKHAVTEQGHALEKYKFRAQEALKLANAAARELSEKNATLEIDLEHHRREVIRLQEEALRAREEADVSRASEAEALKAIRFELEQALSERESALRAMEKEGVAAQGQIARLQEANSLLESKLSSLTQDLREETLRAENAEIRMQEAASKAAAAAEAASLLATRERRGEKDAGSHTSGEKVVDSTASGPIGGLSQDFDVKKSKVNDVLSESGMLRAVEGALEFDGAQSSSDVLAADILEEEEENVSHGDVHSEGAVREAEFDVSSDSVLDSLLLSSVPATAAATDRGEVGSGGAADLSRTPSSLFYVSQLHEARRKDKLIAQSLVREVTEVKKHLQEAKSREAALREDLDAERAARACSTALDPKSHPDAAPYLKNVCLTYMQSSSPQVHAQLLPVVATILHFSAAERNAVAEHIAKEQGRMSGPLSTLFGGKM